MPKSKQKGKKIRLDDKPEVIENRLHINKELMESLIHFYKEQNLLYVINGEGDFDNCVWQVQMRGYCLVNK